MKNSNTSCAQFNEGTAGSNRGFALARLGWIRPLSSKLLQFLGWQCREHRRQFDAENRAAFLAVVAEDFSAVLLHDSETDAQAEARAFADRLGCVKRIENTMRFLDSRTGVGKQGDHV